MGISIIGKVNRSWGNRGFTLVEFMVVICLLGLMVGFALPSLGPRLGRDEGAVNWLAVNMGRFKEMARGGDKTLQLCYLPEIHAFRLTGAGDKSPYFLPETLRVRMESPGGDCIRFYPRGYSDGAKIHLWESGGREFTLVVEPFLGKVGVHGRP
ncbi:MAG: prepilin-type N-terminal cleavage/methylation domain-containing protein [Desulfovibrionales bacterium]|nr:prepilin-type N-terminal cleavage/methylation domain-containing protein [Desulfovibrionales bacterium]